MHVVNLGGKTQELQTCCQTVLWFWVIYTQNAAWPTGEELAGQCS